MDQVVTRFKQPKNPNKKREPKAADKRPGMSPEHLKKIRKLFSCVSGRRPCDPHHLKIKRERGVGLKATDRWAVPLTREEHDDVEKKGRTEAQELAWFQARGIENVYELADALWRNNQSVESMEKVLLAHFYAKRKPGGPLTQSGLD